MSSFISTPGLVFIVFLGIVVVGIVKVLGHVNILPNSGRGTIRVLQITELVVSIGLALGTYTLLWPCRAVDPIACFCTPAAVLLFCLALTRTGTEINKWLFGGSVVLFALGLWTGWPTYWEVILHTSEKLHDLLSWLQQL